MRGASPLFFYLEAITIIDKIARVTAPALRAGIKKERFLVMKIKSSIKIDKANIKEISSLECVDGFDLWHDGTLVVRLNPEFTKGRLTLTSGDYLCQFDSGLWQRYGSEAMSRALMNPRKEGGNQWRE